MADSESVQRVLPIARGRLDGDLDANGHSVTGLRPPSSETDAATKKYVDEHSGASDWSEIRNKPQTFPPSQHTHIMADVNGLILNLNRKRDKTDFDASTPWVVTVPQGGTKTDQSKFVFDFDDGEPYGWRVEYDGYEVRQRSGDPEDAAELAWTDPDDGLEYSAHRTVDAIAKLSQVQSAVAPKYTKPAGGIPASDLAPNVIPDVTGKANTSDFTIGSFAAYVAALFSNANSSLNAAIADNVTPETIAGGTKIAEIAGKAIYAPQGGGGGDDEKMQTVFDELARMDAFTSTSTESDAFDVAITKLSELLGEDVSELAA